MRCSLPAEGTRLRPGQAHADQRSGSANRAKDRRAIAERSSTIIQRIAVGRPSCAPCPRRSIGTAAGREGGARLYAAEHARTRHDLVADAIHRLGPARCADPRRMEAVRGSSGSMATRRLLRAHVRTRPALLFQAARQICSAQLRAKSRARIAAPACRGSSRSGQGTVRGSAIARARRAARHRLLSRRAADGIVSDCCLEHGDARHATRSDDGDAHPSRGHSGSPFPDQPGPREYGAATDLLASSTPRPLIRKAGGYIPNRFGRELGLFSDQARRSSRRGDAARDSASGRYRHSSPSVGPADSAIDYMLAEPRGAARRGGRNRSLHRRAAAGLRLQRSASSSCTNCEDGHRPRLERVSTSAPFTNKCSAPDPCRWRCSKSRSQLAARPAVHSNSTIT